MADLGNLFVGTRSWLYERDRLRHLSSSNPDVYAAFWHDRQTFLDLYGLLDEIPAPDPDAERRALERLEVARRKFEFDRELRTEARRKREPPEMTEQERALRKLEEDERGRARRKSKSNRRAASERRERRAAELQKLRTESQSIGGFLAGDELTVECEGRKVVESIGEHFTRGRKLGSVERLGLAQQGVNRTQAAPRWSYEDD